MFTRHIRDYRDYEVNLGDRCKIRAYGNWVYGTVRGLGGAGFYVEVLGDDGILYDGNTSSPDFVKIHT